MRTFPVILTFLLLWACGLMARQAPLSAGNVLRIEVGATGVYRLTPAQLAQAGWNLAELDPRTFRLYGTRTGALPQPIALSQEGRLTELPILITGEQDGRFNQDDLLLFFAESADEQIVSPGEQLVRQVINPYEDRNFYFLTAGTAGQGRRIATESAAGGAAEEVRDADFYFHHERDLVSGLASPSGRRWFGERYSAQVSENFSFPVTALAPGSAVRLTASVMATSFVPSAFSFAVGGVDTGGSIELPAVPNATYAIKGQAGERTFSLPAAGMQVSGGNLVVRLQYSRPQPSSVGYLDFLGLNLRQRLQWIANRQMIFRHWEQEGRALRFRVSSAPADLQVWDCTTPETLSVIPVVAAAGDALFSGQAGQVRRYVAFRAAEALTPVAVQAIPSQNLAAMPVPELLIITHPLFRTEAERLAAFRRSNDGLAVEVVLTDQIFNEYASGRQDVTAIRNFIHHLYSQNPERLRYLLLFGDASFRYKDRGPENTNFVPTYQSRESLHPIFSFCSDDYYGMMSPEDGEWAENDFNRDDLEIGVGRLPVITPEHARAVVNKLIAYATTPTEGNWGQRLLFVADDGDFNTHQRQADALADLVDRRFPTFQVSRLFVDAFPKEATPFGRRSPALRDELTRQVHRGALVVNYSGHGSETSWASENILDNPTVASWTNSDRLPLFVTATCEYGRFDDPNRQSGAELALLHPQGGAIGLLTTTRPVFASTNFELNRAFCEIAFERENGRLGDIIRQTKNRSIQGVINRNFSLLGDPSMRLAIPQAEAVITGFNGRLISRSDTLKALQEVELSGEIRQDGRVLSQFNGLLHFQLFDQPVERTTLGDDGPGTQMTFRQLERVLFSGQATVRNGIFSLRFQMPKNIDQRPANGRIFLLAHSEQGQQAKGSNDTFLITGTASGFRPDQTPPKMQAFLGSEAFRNGDTVPADTWLLLHLEDESGLAAGLGIGQDMTACLNNCQTQWILNDFLVSQPDQPTRARVRFPLRGLPEGLHTLRVTAWDIHNNSGETTISFRVGAENSGFVEKIFNYPNPFDTFTVFRIRHSLSGTLVQAHLEVFSPTGALVYTSRRTVRLATIEEDLIEWDGRNHTGEPIRPGLLFYRLTVVPAGPEKNNWPPYSTGGKLLMKK